MVGGDRLGGVEREDPANPDSLRNTLRSRSSSTGRLRRGRRTAAPPCRALRPLRPDRGAGPARGRRPMWADRFAAELDNLRAAHGWALAVGDAGLSLGQFAPLPTSSLDEPTAYEMFTWV